MAVLYSAPTQHASHSRAQGSAAESIAADYLQQRGYRIMARNVYTRCGEIDIIAKYGQEYVCVEVKSRNTKSGVHPAQCLSPKKYQNLIRSVLSLPSLYNQAVRIDLITVFQGSVEQHYCDVRAEHTSTGQKMLYALV